jgi:O-methyltransferase involved in polyketide biosynthesis
VEVVSLIDYDFSKFERSWLSQVGVSVRTMLLDNGVRGFLERSQKAVIINLGAGLDTRYGRLGLDGVRWYELDVPESIEFRRHFFVETDPYRFIAKSILDLSWMDDIEDDERSVLLIAEGLFMYFTEEELRPLFGAFADRFPNSDILFEMLAPLLVGREKQHDSLNRLDSAVEFKWGLKDSREMMRWHPNIQFIEEWNYFDYRKDRWKWFGAIARLPIFRPRLANRIVHLRFGDRV